MITFDAIIAQDHIEDTTRIIITDLTTKSALRNNESKEKSVIADDISVDVIKFSIYFTLNSLSKSLL